MFVVYLVLLAAIVLLWSHQAQGATLTTIATSVRTLTGVSASVTCERQPPNIAGRTWKSERRVSLGWSVCRDLLRAPLVRDTSGFSVWVLTHEAGHLIHCDYSECSIEEAEHAADCYAMNHWRAAARMLGFTQIRLLGRQVLRDGLAWRCRS